MSLGLYSIKGTYNNFQKLISRLALGDKARQAERVEMSDSRGHDAGMGA